jgi:hypothetical protein
MVTENGPTTSSFFRAASAGVGVTGVRSESALPANFDLAGILGDNVIQNSLGDLSFHIFPFF